MKPVAAIPIQLSISGENVGLKCSFGDTKFIEDICGGFLEMCVW